MEISAQDENALVERVFLRIGSAESDEQLETALGKFLAPLLLKLNSPSEDVRSKVLNLLAHIKTRLKSRSQIKLPLEALLAQFQDPNATPFITNFTILFIKLGFPRLEPEKQAQLLPLLINCLEGRSVSHQDSILQLLLPALQHIKMPKTDAQVRVMFPLRDKPVVKRLLLDYFMDVLLLPYNSQTSAASQRADDGSDANASSVQPSSGPPPPGLSQAAFQRLISENPLPPDELEKAKLNIITFITSGVVEESDIACHLVVASSDTRHSVTTSADVDLKKIMGSVDWNSKEILSKLFSIFQGTVVVKGQPTVKPEDRRSAVGPRIRLKIFPILLKAREASNMFPACLQLVFDCLFGPTPNAKLRIMAVEFVHHICLNCDQAKFAMLDVVLLNGMLKLIQEAKEDSKLRSLAYVAVGKIGRRSPHRLTKDIQVVQTFFDAICQEEGDTRLAVQEALSLMSNAFGDLDATNKQLLEALLLQNIDKVEPQARMVTVQYAAAVFPSDHIPSRYILMLGAGDIKDDVRSESVKALRKAQSRSAIKPTETTALPDFVEMVNYIAEKGKQRKVSQHRHVAVNAVLPFNPLSYTEILMYLRVCLSQSSGAPVSWEVETLMEHAPVVAKKVQLLLNQYDGDQGPLQLYVQMLQELIFVSSNAEIMYCLLEIVAMVPDILASKLLRHQDWLKNLLSSSKDDIKQFAAELYAIVTFQCKSGAEFNKEVEELLKNLTNKNSELVLGSLLTLGYFVGQKIQSARICEDNKMEISWLSDEGKLLADTVRAIAALLSHNSVTVKTTACLALGEIGRNGPLPLSPGVEMVVSNGVAHSGTESEGADRQEDSKRAKVESDEEITKSSVVKTLIAMIKTSNEANKTKERAASCLGDICVGDLEFPYRKEAITELINSIQSKQVELHFTIGQALVDMAMGPTSPRARCAWTTSKEDHEKNVKGIKDEVAWFLQELLSKYIRHSNPHLRQGACVWLLTLMRQAGHHKAVQESLLDIQRAFMMMLSENDEITQDLASKGLGQVIEVCTPEQKDRLVSELVETLMTGKRSKTEVNADTTVFQSGSLGKAPDGGELSTYKELCAIATDLNQPDLIYKFMNLANHNAMWNARKGAAVGFSTIAAQAGEQLAPYLTQIVPRLYRYQFDPNPKIQQAISGIWNVLVQDNKKTVDTYLKQILDDLLKNLTSNQWRVRESSCMAVTNLLRGRVLDDIVDDIPELWEICLKVRDDIKESVRLAADQACKVLSKVSIKICDVSNGKIGEKATKLILPCLLQCSLHSTVKEVRAIGLSTLLEISRNAGALLKPNIPVLVTALLEATSGLEPEVINYLSLQLGSQSSQDKLDSARIAASKMSPMMETVNRCVQYVDSTVLPDLIPRLVELVKGGIGVSTKAGCSSFTVSLVYQCPQDLSPYSGKLLAAFLHGLNDRNATIRKANATAIGHLVRISKDSSVEKLIQKLKSWYLENEGPNTHHACSVTLHAIAKNSPDCLRRHANLVMPLAFFAMHEQKQKDEGKKADEASEWEDVWNEIAPGTEAGIRLYLAEIITLLSSCLQSQIWSFKVQAAQAMATVAQKLQSQLGQPYLGDLLSSLLDGLSGRTWDGKEAFLKALSTVTTSCKDEIIKAESAGTSQQYLKQIVAVLLRECGKERLQYKMEAMQSLGPVLELYELDHFSEVWDLTHPLLNQVSSNTEDNQETDLGQKQELITCSLTLLGEAWPNNQSTQAIFTNKFVDLLCDSMPVSSWKVQVIIMKDLYKVINRLIIFKQDQIVNNKEQAGLLAAKLLTAALVNLSNVKYIALRTESLALTDLILHRLSVCGQISLVPEPLLVSVTKELSTIADSGPWELRDQAKTATLLLASPAAGEHYQLEAMEH
ncbi:hypothetical protein BsWGS_02666 [Bradybaena similaris]